MSVGSGVLSSDREKERKIMEEHEIVAAVTDRLAEHGVTATAQYLELDRRAHGELHKYKLLLSRAGKEAAMDFWVPTANHEAIGRGEVNPALPGLFSALREAGMVLGANWEQEQWLDSLGFSSFIAPEVTSRERARWDRMVPNTAALRAFFADSDAGLADWVSWAKPIVT
jgi:hypothetical protein